MPGEHFFLFLQGSEEVKEEGAQIVLLEYAGDILIPGTIPAASAPMGENNDSFSIPGHAEISFENRFSCRYPDIFSGVRDR
jgi:hypothetical protein